PNPVRARHRGRVRRRSAPRDRPSDCAPPRAVGTRGPPGVAASRRGDPGELCAAPADEHRRHMSDDRRPSLSLCAWAWNEESIVERFVRKTDADLRRVADDYELIVVDDGSTDRTGERLRALRHEVPSLRIATHGRNLGYGACFRTTIGMATKDVILWNTVDMF